MKLEITTTNTEQSVALGKKLGSALKGGEIIQLASDLGGGKTTLTRGIAAGAGSKDVVGSPTFTISRLYKAPNLNIYHFDFYRLNEPGIVEYELTEAADDSNSVLIVEWADIVNSVLPKERILIDILHIGDEGRLFKLNIPTKYSYISKELS